MAERRANRGSPRSVASAPGVLVVGFVAGMTCLAAHGEPPLFAQNGEPVFPIGLWSSYPGSQAVDDHRAELAGAGFNVLHRWYSHVTPTSLDTDRL